MMVEYQSDVDIAFRDIDLLKCRSFAVVHRLGVPFLPEQHGSHSLFRFTDSEVLAPDFKEKVAVVAKIMQPFVHW